MGHSSGYLLPVIVSKLEKLSHPRGIELVQLGHSHMTLADSAMMLSLAV
jgi:hypothetical protein